MPESPHGYQPYRESDFPPKIIGYISHALAAILTIFAIIFYQPDSGIEYLSAVVFGIGANIYFHESIHFITQSGLGFDPVFEFPNKVWTPNEAMGVKDAVLSLLSPQILTFAYLVLLPLINIEVIEFMIAIALIFNLTGGIQDISWAIRRLLWPSGNLVFVDSEGREYFSFPE